VFGSEGICFSLLLGFFSLDLLLSHVVVHGVHGDRNGSSLLVLAFLYVLNVLFLTLEFIIIIGFLRVFIGLNLSVDGFNKTLLFLFRGVGFLRGDVFG
jgi:hypothetical protein